MENVVQLYWREHTEKIYIGKEVVPWGIEVVMFLYTVHFMVQFMLGSFFASYAIVTSHFYISVQTMAVKQKARPTGMSLPYGGNLRTLPNSMECCMES